MQTCLAINLIIQLSNIQHLMLTPAQKPQLIFNRAHDSSIEPLRQSVQEKVEVTISHAYYYYYYY